MRLRLRPLEDSDAAPTSALIVQEVSRWTGSWPPVVTPEEVSVRIGRTRAEISAGLRLEQVIERADGELLGWVGMVRKDPQARTASLGYWVGLPFHGQGYATEAATLILEEAWRAWKLDLVEALVQPGNAGSRRVMLKLGARQVGDRATYSTARQRWEICNAFELTRADFDGRPGPREFGAS